jgi:transcription elongation GreA/GreB family factor
MIAAKKWKDKEKLAFKQKLKDYCIEQLRGKVEEAIKSMERAQEAANGEEKSSMGDKYEITKAMGQIDSDRAGLQLFESKKQLSQLNLVNIDTICKEVKAGAFVICETMNYFIATSIGGKVIDNEKINIISAAAPIAQLLMNKKAGENFVFNGNKINVLDVF